MGLEIPTNKTPGDEIRRTEPERRAAAGFMILALTLLELVFVYLVFYAIFQGYNSPVSVGTALEGQFLTNILKSDQQIIAFWLACIFFNLSFITLLYQRYFLDHVTIAKKRFRKWEDEGVQMHE